MVERAVIAGVLLFAALLTGGLGVIGIYYRSEPGAEWFTGVSIISAILICMDAIEYIGTNWFAIFIIEWAGTALYITIPVVWFAFILSYVGYEQLLTRRWLGALFVIPGVSILSMIAMEHNTLYFRYYEITSEAGHIIVEAPPGPLAYLSLLFSYLLFAIGLYVVVRMLVRGGKLFSGQALWLLVGTLAPITGGLLTAFGPDLERVFPPFPFGLALFSVCFGYGLFRHRIFDLTPATRNLGTTTAFQSLDEGIIVLNTNEVVVRINEGACKLFQCERDRVLGTDVGTIHPALTALDGRPQPVDIDHAGRVLEVTSSMVDGVRNQGIGKAIVVRDVTTQRDQKQRLSVLNRVLRHNLRNDLMVVQALANELKTTEDEEVVDHASSIIDKTKGLVSMAEKARTIQETFDDADPSAHPVALPDLFETVVDRVQSTTGPIPISVEVPADATVHTDGQTLELVVQTLLENAVTHGCPDPEAIDSDEPPPVRLTASVTDETLTVTIDDDGPGIPPAEYRILTSDTESSLDHGSGLGLWLAKWGAARLGGNLSFAVDDGTTVKLEVALN